MTNEQERELIFKCQELQDKALALRNEASNIILWVFEQRARQDNAEGEKTPTNTRMVAALEVYEEYLQSIEGVYPTPSFRDYCKQRLNA